MAHLRRRRVTRPDGEVRRRWNVRSCGSVGGGSRVQENRRLAARQCTVLSRLSAGGLQACLSSLIGVTEPVQPSMGSVRRGELMDVTMLQLVTGLDITMLAGNKPEHHHAGW